MLIDLRDSLAAIYEHVSVIIKQPPAELERVRKPRSAAPFLVVLAVVGLIVATAVTFNYVEYELFADNILSAVH